MRGILLFAKRVNFTTDDGKEIRFCEYQLIIDNKVDETDKMGIAPMTFKSKEMSNYAKLKTVPCLIDFDITYETFKNEMKPKIGRIEFIEPCELGDFLTF